MTAITRSNDYTRFDVLDFYRYGGALFVALDHFTAIYLPVDASVRARADLLQPLMGFFFTLSGFVLMHVYDRRIDTVADYFRYLQKRLARIYPLHLATFALAVVWGILGTQRYWFTADGVVPNILLLHAWNTTGHLSFNYPSWSVSAEFFVYLLFPLLLVVVDFAGSWAVLLLAAASVLPILWVFHVCRLGPWTLATYDFGCLRAVPSFIAGMAIYRLAAIRFAVFAVPPWMAHGLAVATVPMMLLGVPNAVVLTTFVVVVFLLARAEPPTPGLFSAPWVRALSNCSYGFYMLHAFVGVLVLHLVPKFFHLGSAWVFGLCVPALALTTALAIISFHFFEAPARRYFSGLRMRREELAWSDAAR